MFTMRFLKHAALIFAIHISLSES